MPAAFVDLEDLLNAAQFYRALNAAVSFWAVEALFLRIEKNHPPIGFSITRL